MPRVTQTRHGVALRRKLDRPQLAIPGNGTADCEKEPKVILRHVVTGGALLAILLIPITGGGVALAGATRLTITSQGRVAVVDPSQADLVAANLGTDLDAYVTDYGMSLEAA
jgi:hypothetical protein